MKPVKCQMMPSLPLVLVTSRKKLDKLDKKYGINITESSLSNYALAIYCTKGHESLAIVWLNMKELNGATESDVLSLLAHEASHVVDDYFRDIGESNPGDEERAYATERVMYELIEAYKREVES